MRNSPLIHICGEVLFDHFPDGSRILGGAPFNVASGICSPSDSLPACRTASVPIRKDKKSYS